LEFGVQPVRDISEEERGAFDAAIAKVWSVLQRPSQEHKSLGDWVGPLVEDLLCFDAGVWEYVERPTGIPGNDILALELVPGYSIAKNIEWDGDPEKPRWAQIFEGLPQGEAVRFLDRELEYLTQRERTWAPYGLSQLETVVDVMESYLRLSAYQSEVASQAYPAFLLYLGELSEDEVAAFKMYWDAELAGKAKPGIFANTGGKPESLQTKPIGDAGLYMEYWDRLTRIVAFSFDLKPMDFGLEFDVNRSTAEVSERQSVEEARRPIAELIRSRINGGVIPRIAEVTGDELVRELEFFWIGLNPADEEKNSRIHATYLGNDVLKIDDVRGFLDLDPLPNNVGQMTLTAYREFMKIDLGNALLPEPLIRQTEEALEAARKLDRGPGNGYRRRPRRTSGGTVR